jgi:hypothetical protein
VPGGRWNKFKTYSTIQRTFEIWSFAIAFVFKAWLNNQKFMYRGERHVVMCVLWFLFQWLLFCLNQVLQNCKPGDFVDAHWCGFEDCEVSFTGL